MSESEGSRGPKKMEKKRTEPRAVRAMTNRQGDGPMCRIGWVRAWGVLLVGAGAGLAVAEEGPPPLSAPALVGPGEAPAAPLPAPAAETGSAAAGPVLVVPGVTTPGRVRAMSRLPVLDPAGPAPLIGPTGGIEPLSAISGLPAPSTPANALSLESVPGDEPVGSNPETAPIRPIPRETKPAPTPARAPAASRRGLGLFNRMLTPPAFLTGRSGSDNPRSSITVEPRADPAADAALKRRVEHQIQESLGDRVRSVEVRVVGRDVTILAKPARFWQRRTVRRTLEMLPSLTGYHAKIEVED